MKDLSISAREKADKIGVAMMDVLKGTSVQYAVRYKGEVVISGSVGKYDKAESRPLGNDVMYGVGSISKIFVTASAMLLSDKGLLDIDKPFKSYMPEFEMADPRHASITTRHLMNHSSGIYGTHFKGAFLFEDNSTFAHDNLLTLLKPCTLKYDPGTFSEYCNDGFQLLELLVERISKMPYNEFLEKNFFAPLGIKNTKTPQDDYDRTQMARFSMPQLYDGDLPYETTNLIGTGGIVSTAEDLCLFGQVLMGKKILSEKSAKLMAVKEYESCAFWPIDEEQDNLFAYGLGYDHVHVPPFDKVGLRALCKGGDTSHYHGSLIVIPELDLAAASLSAGGASFANYQLIIELLKDACLEFGLVKEFPPAKEFIAPVKQEMPSDLQKYAGLYAENGKFANIEIKNGEIELDAMLMNLVPAQKYVYAGDGKFISPDGKHKLHFADVKGGLTFMQGDLTIELPGIGMIGWKSFMYQKLDKNPLDAKVATAWKARQGKKYVLVDDISTSANFLTMSETTMVDLKVDIEHGYAFGGAKITDENYAKNVLYARDVVDLEFYTENGAEYLRSRGTTLIDSSAIPQLKSDTKSIVIPENGFTQFFKIGDDLAGKTITVKLPRIGVFAAYAKKDEKSEQSGLKALTTVMSKNTVELAKEDTLAFNANPGDVFKIELI